MTRHVNPDVSDIDVSLVIPLHAEGLLAHPALLSANRMRNVAASAGIQVELVLALDDPSIQTRRVVDAFNLHPRDQVVSIAARDVGATRNKAISMARGRRIVVCDGDDFLSANFIQSASSLIDRMGVGAVVRPQLVVYFDQDRYIYWQRGSNEDGFDPACMLVVNPWTSACMADRSVFLQCPYSEHGGYYDAFGYEDWHWNCEIVAHGLVNVVAAQSIHYVRLKSSGSLNISNISNSVLIPPSALFQKFP